MKKTTLFIIGTLALVLLFTGCQRHYKKISFSAESLGEALQDHITENTSVIGSREYNAPQSIPMYSISERVLSDDEYNLILSALRVKEDDPAVYITRKGNSLLARLHQTDEKEKYSFSDEETLKMATDVFDRLPVISDEYECLGVKSYHTVSDSAGERVISVGVSFRRLIEGIRVVGNDVIYLYFDNYGLSEVHIELYDYKKTNDKIDLKPFDSAYARVKSPDSFNLREENESIGEIDTLNVEKIMLLMVNQYSNGCTVLQPVYSFSGTATDVKGECASFISVIIAVD